MGNVSAAVGWAWTQSLARLLLLNQVNHEKKAIRHHRNSLRIRGISANRIGQAITREKNEQQNRSLHRQGIAKGTIMIYSQYLILNIMMISDCHVDCFINLTTLNELKFHMFIFRNISNKSNITSMDKK